MTIGIDARMYGLEHAGVGRYVSKVIENILALDRKNHYILFIRPKDASRFVGKKRVTVVPVNIPIYSFAEQLILPFVFAKYRLDLLHVPHFNAPLLYPGKYVLTIHDLIKHDSIGPETTTRNKALYHIKRLGYLFLTTLITKRAAHVLVPSIYVKNDVTNRLHVSPDKITVTYESHSGSLKDLTLSDADKQKALAHYSLTQPFVVYTGNLYPHKNVDLLVDAIAQHNQNKEVDLQLVISCARSVFWERMHRKIQQKNLESSIKMLGFVDDDELSKIYSLAIALVHPSKLEGFGLTGLEAMSVGLPVLAARSSCLPEVYGDAALYFDPNSLEDLTDKLAQVIKDYHLRQSLIEKGYLQTRKYSWSKTGKATLDVYRQVLNI